MLSLGPLEIMLIVALALIFLGPERLPEVARQVGKVVGQVRRTTDDLKRTLDAEIRDEERERRLADYRERQAAAKARREASLAAPDPAPPEAEAQVTPIVAPSTSAPVDAEEPPAVPDPEVPR